MGTGYTRNDTPNNIADGNVINASDLDGEFDSIQAAFNASTGHSHDGTTGEGPQIGTGGIADLAVTTGKIANDAVTLGTKTSGNYVATIATSAGLDGSASSEGATPTISLNLNELTTSTTDGDGDYFVVVDTGGTQRKLTKANIAVSGFNTANGIALGTDTTGNYIATGAVSGVGLSGSASAEGATFTITSNATSANTGSTIVARDASGNFSAGTITASLTGTASNAALLDSIDSTSFLRSDAADTKTSGDLSFSDNVKAIFGAGSDLQIYHDGSHSWIKDTGSGNLRISASSYIQLQNDAGTETMALFNDGGDVSLRYGGAEKLATTVTGIDVTGVITTDGMTTSADINFGDNDKAIFGAGSDLQIYHDGTHSYVRDEGTGGLILTTNGAAVYIQKGDSETSAEFDIDGAVKLRYDNSQKFSTTATGVDVTGVITTDGMTTSADINFGDNDKAVFGAGSDLQIYHDGSHSRIKDSGTGNIIISADNFQIKNAADTKDAIYVASGGAVTLYYDNAAKFATTSTGVDVTGNINAVDNIYLASTIYHEGDTDTYMQFHAANEWRVVTGGTERLEVNNSSVTINDGGASYDFRVESDTSTHMLFVDGSANRIGINDSTPSYTLDVTGDINFTGTLRQNGTAFSGGGGLFKGENGEVGSSAGDIFRVHEQTLNTNVTIDSDENGLCAGPLTIATGVTLTVNGNLSIV